jgi:hypothetical protein
MHLQTGLFDFISYHEGRERWQIMQSNTPRFVILEMPFQSNALYPSRILLWKCILHYVVREILLVVFHWIKMYVVWIRAMKEERT